METRTISLGISASSFVKWKWNYIKFAFPFWDVYRLPLAIKQMSPQTWGPKSAGNFPAVLAWVAHAAGGISWSLRGC